ncbi:MAG: F0F1 ATP synthase subunit A [bacterium]
MAHHPSPWDFVYNSLFIIVLLTVIAFFATRVKNKIPRGLQNAAEQVYETFEYLTVSVIGEHGRRYTPLIGSVFTFILISNLWGQLSWLSEITRPIFKFYVVPPTASLNTNIAIALTVFVFVQFEGIRVNGPLGYLKHFAGPMIALSPIMFLIELIGELAKPLSLSLRLYGNIYGEEQIIGVLAGYAKSTWVVPLQFPMMVFGVFTSVVQALVFTMLTCIYLSLMTEHAAEHSSEKSHDTHEDKTALAEAKAS